MVYTSFKPLSREEVDGPTAEQSAGVDIEKATRAEAERLMQQEFYSPKGSIYRCWALGMCSGTRLCLMTLSVFIVQTLGPFLVIDYSWRKLVYEETITVWAYIDELYDAQNIQMANVNVTKLPSKLEFVLFNHRSRKLIQMKVLGGVLLALVFMSTDRKLLEQELHTNQLRRFFQFTSCKTWHWLWIDSLCIGLSLMCISACLGTFLSYETSVPDLVLDAVGLYFLSNACTIGLDIRYGTGKSRYRYLFMKAYGIWANLHCARQIPKEKDYEHVTFCSDVPLLQKATVMVSLFRIASCFISAIELPKFLFLVPSGRRHDFTSFGPSAFFWHGWATGRVWLPFTIAILCFIGVNDILSYLKLRKRLKERPSWDFFISHLIFRRPYMHEEIETAARSAVAAGGDKSHKIHELEDKVIKLSGKERGFGWNPFGSTFAQSRHCGRPYDC